MQEAFGWDSIMNETSRKIYYLNTVSYQWTLFKDFGLWGVLTVSCLWGWCATWMHRQAISCKNPVITVLSGTFQFSVFFGFFAWYFVIPSYLIAIVVMAWLARLSSSSHREAVAHAR
jgi:oligosaccharide repeat unit polymerase